MAYSRWTLEDAVRLQFDLSVPAKQSCTVSALSLTGSFRQLTADISKALLDNLPDGDQHGPLVARRIWACANFAVTQPDHDNVGSIISWSAGTLAKHLEMHCPIMLLFML